MKLERLTQVLSSFKTDMFKSFDYGEQPDMNEAGDDLYPMLYLEEPILGSVDAQGDTTMEFSIMMLNKDTEQGYKAHTAWVDSCIATLEELREYLTGLGYMVNTISFLTLRSYGSDVSSGIRIDLNLTDKFRCRT